ncbi:MAG: RluA family pseudouridine synthase [Agathobacter sp.]|nr:RluA family pseudouridine synthase [Agathobacter sp.]
MERKLDYIITEEFHNKTIDQFLQNRQFPHQVIVQLKKTENGIILNDHWAYVTEKLATGDHLHLHLMEEETDTSIQPIYVEIPIVYEDEDILIIDKPANMPIHPSMNHHEGTLANGLLYYFREKGEAFTFRCINRLDRDTTGLTIVAKHMLSAGILSRMVQNREIKRTYQAICQGLVPEEGTIDAPIARVHDSTIERCVNFEDGERAITHFKRLDYNEERDLSLVELRLETGRTHQIRVHMKHLGHPILGDFLYNPDYRYINRQSLHSASLEFVHPITTEKMHFSAPLHGDMKCILKLD